MRVKVVGVKIEPVEAEIEVGDLKAGAARVTDSPESVPWRPSGKARYDVSHILRIGPPEDRRQ